ncbi:reverse transcriptase [Tanacetum coccineum]
MKKVWMFDVGTLTGDEVFAEQEVAAKHVNLTIDEVTLAQTLAALKNVKSKLCSRNKSDLAAYPGLLQPLPIPDKVWQDISLDFIEALPVSQGKTVIMVVADRLNSSLDLVDRSLQAKEETIALLKFNMKTAQDRMKSYADKKRNDREFLVGDYVYLKLQPYRQLTMRLNKQHTLSAKFYGPFKVLEKVGKAAYKLELPPTAQVHSVFHVSQLKKCHSQELSKQGNIGVVYGLIQWSNGTKEDVTWELLSDLEKRDDNLEVKEESIKVDVGIGSLNTKVNDDDLGSEAKSHANLQKDVVSDVTHGDAFGNISAKSGIKTA